MNKMNTYILLFCFLVVSTFNAFSQNIIHRVNIRKQLVEESQIVDGQWIPIGINKPYAISRDTLLFKDKIAYRFELQEDDNLIDGFKEGEKVSMAELTYCYATPSDYKSEFRFKQMEALQIVHYDGKGIIPQGSESLHSFSLFIPDGLNNDVNVIFAQWHSMPTRTALEDRYGKYYSLEDVSIYEKTRKMKFIKGLGYENGVLNGWKCDHGGHPVLSVGFSSGYLYVKANSDRKWITDLEEECDANFIEKSVSTIYKTSAIVSQFPIDKLPRNRWITFKLNVKWSSFDKISEEAEKGRLYVEILWNEEYDKRIKHVLSDNEELYIGRNDKHGYYFKFGAYRINNNKEPICYYLSDYSQIIKK